jgi:hypothetical protein
MGEEIEIQARFVLSQAANKGSKHQNRRGKIKYRNLAGMQR